MENCVSVTRIEVKSGRIIWNGSMNEEYDWDQNVEDVVEGPAVFVSREEVLQALNEMKTGKALGPSEVSLELIAASGGVLIQVMAEICQNILDGFGMPAEWALSTVFPIFKGMATSGPAAAIEL